MVILRTEYQFIEEVLRKLNYAYMNDELFTAEIKLFAWENRMSWEKRGYGQLKIVRQLEVGPCRGSVRIFVFMRGSMTTLVEHSLEDEMQVGT
jgi:hypothetical protein